MLMQAIAHGGCTNTVKESTLKADSESKVLAASGNRTRDRTAPGFPVPPLAVELFRVWMSHVWSTEMWHAAYVFYRLCAWILF